MSGDGDRREADAPPFAEPELPPRRVSRADASVAPDPEVGETISGYELLELLGRGGAGSVFKARRTEDGTVVALKVLAASKVKRARIVQRFFDEVRAASSVAHPGLVRVFDFIEEETPRRLAYAMEYVDGEVLRAKLKREGALDLRTAIQVAIQICEALSALHDHGIIHRDLKPENILIIDGGPKKMPKVKLLDFGVVKFLPVDRTGGAAATSDEKPGTFVGTPRYMAPEQAAGATVDVRADLFSVGVMLFEMITGRCPHEGDSLRDVVLAKLKGAPRITVNPEKEILPQELTEIVDGCLQLKPALRPSKATSVASALRETDMVLFAVGPVRAREPSAARPVRAVSSERVVVPKAMSRPPSVANRPARERPISERPNRERPISERRPAPSEDIVAAPVEATVPVVPQAEDRSMPIVLLLAAICVAAAVALSLLWWKRQEQTNPMHVVPVAPAATSTTSP